MARAQPDTFDRILDSVQRCSAPIWASESTSALPTTVDHNGTCGFMDTGSRKILLTAWHVVEKFQQLKSQHASAVLAVNLGAGCTAALENPEIIDSDVSFDIASIAFPYLDTQTTPHDKTYFPVRTWPISRAEAGNLVAMVGFPGQRRQTAATWGSFEPVGAGYVVASASDRTIVLTDESGTMRLVTSAGVDTGTVRLGGFSGTPVFLVHPTGPQIIGILRAGSESMGQGAGNTIFLTPTYFLGPDGSFDRNVMP